MPHSDTVLNANFAKACRVKALSSVSGSKSAEADTEDMRMWNMSALARTFCPRLVAQYATFDAVFEAAEEG